METFLDSTLFTWVILPILIFCARIGDVSVGTMRIVMIGRGHKIYAAILGFFEVSIWLLVARQVIMHLPNVLCFFAYSGGFAAGNFVGMWIEERMASGAQMVRVVINNDGQALMEALQARGYGVTNLKGQGAQGEVHLIFTIIGRQDARAVVKLIEGVNPKAFYTIEDVREVSEGVFPPRPRRGIRRFIKRK